MGTVPIGQDRFGAVESAHLGLACASLMRAEYGAEFSDKGREISADGVAHSLLMYMDSSEVLSYEVGEAIYLLVLYRESSGSPAPECGSASLEQPAVGAERSREKFIDLDLRIKKDGPESHDKTYKSYGRGGGAERRLFRGLVLRHIDGSKGCFERVGSFDIFSFAEYVNCQQFMQAVHGVGVTTAEATCAEIRADATPSQLKYLIDLV